MRFHPGHQSFSASAPVRVLGRFHNSAAESAPTVPLTSGYRLPLARLWVAQSISQFWADESPPLLHAETWSASISSGLQMRALLTFSPAAHSGQLDLPLACAAWVCCAYATFFVFSSNTRTARSFFSVDPPNASSKMPLR